MRSSSISTRLLRMVTTTTECLSKHTTVPNPNEIRGINL